MLVYFFIVLDACIVLDILLWWALTPSFSKILSYFLRRRAGLAVGAIEAGLH